MGVAQSGPGRAPLPVVWILATGETIAGKGDSSSSLTNHKAGSIFGENLVKAVPEVYRHATVKVEQIANINSSDMTIERWLTLSNRINRILAWDPKTGGVVITHGTNTLKDTAYFLNLIVK